MNWARSLAAIGLLLIGAGSALALPPGAGARAVDGAAARSVVNSLEGATPVRHEGAGFEAGATAPSGPEVSSWIEGFPGVEIASLSGTAAAVEGEFQWPVPPPVQIVRPFDLPAEPWLAGHRGVDLDAPAGSNVLAPAAGTVSFNGWIVDRHVLVLQHGELASTLEPVVSDLAVGDWAEQGANVGAVAAGEAWHCQDCLHWGVRRGDQHLDPTLLVDPRPRAVLWR
ncbi:MAG: peptidoglycan DD-metalloendopeptidase family protein [Bifidobacteriaceae bacterium]|jgi:murein DD-endopeptidase MepM/ murein hydrolase activator NlpD|nr:peptidoglycan DD-metalloendopeptidase family protein [Bifidobacteriaceae bacterium]